jgi:acyl-CoA oxidase
MKTLINFGGSDYHKSLVERASRLDFIGCFCMTELSHGSNVMALQTTATYDIATKEFVINTPSERDMKIWIGNLAKDATYGIVFAKLITLGKDYGVHPFIV